MKARLMKNNLSIVNIEKIDESNIFKVTCLVDNEEREYQIKFEGIGASIPGELEDLTTQSLKRSWKFGEIIFAFYQGEHLVFPIDLNNL